MSGLQPVQGLKRRVYTHRLRETAYNDGTPWDASDPNDVTPYFVWQARRNEGTAFRPSPILTTDAQTANNSEWAKQQIYIRSDLKENTLPLLATPEGVAYWFAMALGDDTIFAADEASATSEVFGHWLQPAPLSDGYPGSFWLEEHMAGSGYDSALDFRNAGCIVKSVSLSGARSGLTNLDVTLFGSGTTFTPESRNEAGYVIPGEESTFFPSSAVKILLVPVSSYLTTTYAAPTTAMEFATTDQSIPGAVDVSPLIETWNLTWTNNFDDSTKDSAGTATGGGTAGGCAVWDDRGYSLQLNMAEGAGSTWAKSVLNGTTSSNVNYAAIIELTSDWVADTDNDGGTVNYYGHNVIMARFGMIEETPESTFGGRNQVSLNLVQKSDGGLAPSVLFDVYGLTGTDGSTLYNAGTVYS